MTTQTTEVTVSSQAKSAWVPLDLYRAPFNVGLSVILTAGADLTYTVEFTRDNVQAKTFVAASANAFSVSSALNAKTATATGSLTEPATAVRLNVSSYTSGSATLQIAQAGV